MWHPMLCREISLLLACQTKLLTHTHPFVGIHAKRLSWFLNNGQKTKYITAEPAFSRRFKEWASSYRVNTKVIGRLWVIGLWLYVRESILSGSLTRSTGTRRNVECRLSHIYWRLWTTPFLSSGLPAKALQEQICSVTSCVQKKKKTEVMRRWRLEYTYTGQTLFELYWEFHSQPFLTTNEVHTSANGVCISVLLFCTDICKDWYETLSILLQHSFWFSHQANDRQINRSI